MVAVGGSVRAVLAITDPLKPEARGVVAALARRGLSVHLVTGDNWRTARAIAEQLAIVNVCAECLPGAKADKIRVLPLAYTTPPDALGTQYHALLCLEPPTGSRLCNKCYNGQ